MIENLEAVETALKLEAGSLQKGIDNEEKVSLEIPKLVIRTPEEDDERSDNLRNEFKTEHHTAGIEVAVKEARTEHELDFTGKNLSNLLKAYKVKVLKESGIEPNKKIDELTKDNDALRTSMSNLQGEFDESKESFAREGLKRGNNDRVLLKFGDKASLGKNDRLILFNATHELQPADENGIVGVKRDGQLLKDDMRKIIPFDKIVSDFDSKYISQPSGGNAGDDEPGDGSAGKTDLDKFTKEMKDQGIEPMTEKFVQEQMKRQKAGTLKI